MEKLQELRDVTVRASEEKGLMINMDKTKVLVASKANTPRIRIRNIITEDCRCEKEIRTRIGIGKSASKRMKAY